MAVRCCFGCVAPKRHVGCHATCPEYIEESDRNQKERELRHKSRAREQELWESRHHSVAKALKHRRK